jgi:hypothetical protein
MNKQAPTSVRVIGWFWRVGGIGGMVLALPLALKGGEWWGSYWADSIRTLSPGVLFVWAFLASLICLLLGNGILPLSFGFDGIFPGRPGRSIRTCLLARDILI